MTRNSFLAAALAAAVVSTAATAPVRAQDAGPHGTLIVTNKSPSTVTVVDIGTSRVLATLPTGTNPHEVALSPDGRTAVITNYGGERRTLTVIDVPALRVARTIDLDTHRAPHGIVFLSDNRHVVVTVQASRHILIVDALDGRIAAAIPTEFDGSHMVGVTADGTRAFTGNTSANTVSELDLTNRRFVRSFEVPQTPEAINVTPDGQEVWVGSNATGRVSVLNPATGAVSTAIEGLRWPYRMLLSPDTRLVIVPDPTLHEVRFISRADRREVGRVSFPGGGPQGVTITPDGRYVLLSLSARGEVAIIDTATRQTIRQVSVGRAPDGIAFSPTRHPAASAPTP